MEDEPKAIVTFYEAVQEVAKTTGKVIDAGRDLAPFLNRVFGAVPEDVVGILGGDWLHQARMRNGIRMLVRTKEILESRGITSSLKEIAPKHLRPLLGAAADDNDDEVVELWASLLANAMDPNKDVDIRGRFVETLNKFDPIDVRIFKLAGQNQLPDEMPIPNVPEILGKRASMVEISLDHLMELKCVIKSNIKVMKKGGGSTRVDALRLTVFGAELYRACEPDGAD